MALPSLVTRYLERALPHGEGSFDEVLVKQIGEMWLKPGGRAMRFLATETFSVGEVAFSWRARFRILPLVPLHVVDGFADGQGALEGRLFGVKIMRQSGPEVSIGEAMRYLAELVWVPQAMIANRHLEWSEVDDRAVEVATTVSSTRVAVQLEFDANGDIVGARSDARPYREGKSFVPRPWAGSFGDYAVVGGGTRIPTSGEVRWELPDGPYTYWRGRIMSLELAYYVPRVERS
jgi:hypothetical protein